MTAQIFISYRRLDSFHAAVSVCAALQAEVGSDAVFMDKNNEPGDDWPDEIRNALANAKTVLVVVVDWDKWLGVHEHGKRRIDDPKDWVRQEISTALCRNKKIIPVLISPNVEMITPEVLPDDIRQLTQKQKYCLRNDAWDDDLRGLVGRFCRSVTAANHSVRDAAALTTSEAQAPKPNNHVPLATAPALRIGQWRTGLRPWRRGRMGLAVCVVALFCCVALYCVGRFWLQSTPTVGALPEDRGAALEKLGGFVVCSDGRWDIEFRDAPISDLFEVSRLLTVERQAFELTLTLSNCNELVDLEPLLSVQVSQLNIVKCENLRHLWTHSPENRPAFPLEKCLTRLVIYQCNQLSSCRGVSRCEALGHLSTRDCPRMVALGVDELSETLPLSALKHLDLSETAVTGLDDWPAFGALEVVWLTKCKNLASVAGLSRQAFLTKVDLSGCTALKTLAGLPPSGLIAVGIQGMSPEIDVSALGEVNLTELYVDSGTKPKVVELNLQPTPRLRESMPKW